MVYYKSISKLEEFMEYLDILDNNGKKTGEKKPRKEVHSKG